MSALEEPPHEGRAAEQRDGGARAGVDVVTEIVIERSPAEVAAYAADPDHAPLWYENIAEVRWETPRPMRAGSRLAFVARFLGRRLSYTYEVAELIPGERLVMHTAEGPFPMETSYEWTEVGDGATRMKLRNRGFPSGFARIVSPFVARAMRRANEKDLSKLKVLLEGDR